MNVSEYSIHIPDHKPFSEALSRTTHLAIGAHQDDLEIFAFHGIASCYEKDNLWFGGVTVTDGAGCARSGKFKEVSDEEMVQIRKKEQNDAADLGKYAFQAQLCRASSEVKDPAKAGSVIEVLLEILLQTKPNTVYLHNPADKHDSHIAVLTCCLEAIRRMPVELRPKEVYGCEVWRDLDWVEDNRKVVLRTDQNTKLATALIDVFESQIAGGKNYTHSTLGRRMANATYFQPREVDNISSCTFALDLLPLIQDENLNLSDFTISFIEQFKTDVTQRIARIQGHGPD